jgi:hypothetical protein
MTLRNIKDMTPNQETIRMLEAALEQARSGELRSVVIVKGWGRGGVCHCWSLDKRNYWRLLLAEIVMMQHDFTVNIELRDGDSVLSGALS